MLFMSSQKCFSLVLFRAFVCLFFKTCNHLISKILLVFIAFGSVIKVFSGSTSGHVLCTGAFCIRHCWFLCRDAAMLLILAIPALAWAKPEGFYQMLLSFFLYDFFFFLTCMHAFLLVMLLSFLIFSLKVL